MNYSIWFLRISVLWFLFGIGFGEYASFTHVFDFTPVHVHINLIGWVSMALMGIIYYLFPQAANSALGKIHFWLITICLPIMMGALFLVIKGNQLVAKYLAFTGTGVALAVLLFAINVWVNVKPPQKEKKEEKEAA